MKLTASWQWHSIVRCAVGSLWLLSNFYMDYRIDNRSAPNKNDVERLYCALNGIQTSLSFRIVTISTLFPSQFQKNKREKKHTN